jgi:hypothetical protein
MNSNFRYACKEEALHWLGKVREHVKKMKMQAAMDWKAGLVNQPLKLPKKEKKYSTLTARRNQ